MKWIYLVLAIVGAILPYLFFTQFFMQDTASFQTFVGALFVNPATSGFTVDLLFTSLVFWIYMIHAYKKRNGPFPLVFILFNIMIGLSCAIPAYLFMKAISKK